MTEELIDNIINERRMSSAEYRYHLRHDTLCILQEEFNFEIVQFLGEGSYGEVIAVNSPHFEETVAVKIIRSDDTWIGELTLWPLLDHQNVLPLLEFIQLPHADLFVTPMMYSDMETILEDEDFFYDQDFLDLAKRWLREVLDALDYFHCQKLCHLDLKADNVLIDYGLNAVLCDFSFLSHSDEPVERYGVPLPYRPPETCLAFEKCVPADGIKFDMWSYGILALNVFTNHFLKQRIHLEMKTWHRDIYPLLYEAMQITYFRYLMSKAFPLSSTEYEFSDAFNFVQYILRVQPEERPCVEEVVNHIFFKNGFNRIEKPDDIWIIREKTKCSCVQPEKLLVLRKDNFEHYKSRKTFKRTGIPYQKRRKWEKPSTVIKNKKQVVESAFDVLEKSDVANDEQYDEKNFTLKIQETVDPSVEAITPGDMAFSHTVDKNAKIEVHYDDDKFQTFGPTGDEVTASEKGSWNENEKKECIGNDLEVNMMCRINERSFANTELENQKLTEVRLSMEPEESVNVTVDTDASVTLPSVSDITEEELHKKDLRTWFREKLNICTANIRKIMMTHQNVKKTRSDSSLPKI